MCVGLVRERRERQEREKEGLRRGGKSPQCNAPSWHVPSNYVVTSDVKMPQGPPGSGRGVRPAGFILNGSPKAQADRRRLALVGPPVQ